MTCLDFNKLRARSFSAAGEAIRLLLHDNGIPFEDEHMHRVRMHATISHVTDAGRTEGHQGHAAVRTAADPVPQRHAHPAGVLAL